MNSSKINPLVSILIPAYNAEKWIRDTINSALCQTWPNKEIIVVDDGSIDNTLSIAISMESEIVKVVSQKNRGASFARNKALELSKGDYIQWLDADDLLHPDKIIQQVRVAEKDNNPLILYSSSFGTFYSRIQNAEIQPNKLWKDLSPIEWMITKFSYRSWMSVVSWLISRNLCDVAGCWDETLTLDDDGEYICRIVSASEKIKFVPEAICYYRIGNTNSLSGLNMTERRLASQYMSIVKQISYLIRLEDSERTRLSCLIHMQNHYIKFYPENHELIVKLNDLANKLGGTLVPPILKLKYRTLQLIFGWGIAKYALFGVMPKIKYLLNKYK